VPQAVAQLPEQAANEKGPMVVALLTDLSVLEKLQQLVAKIPWGQNFLLIEKVKDLSTRLWYMQKPEYEMTHALPDSLKSALPMIEEIEAELGEKE
jgi:hypothetical protein